MEGVLIQSERPGSFVPSNEPAQPEGKDSGSSSGSVGGQWFWLDGPAIAEAVGLPRDTPLIERVVEQQPQWASSPILPCEIKRKIQKMLLL